MIKRFFRIIVLAAGVMAVTACKDGTIPQEQMTTESVITTTEANPETESNTATQNGNDSKEQNQAVASAIPVISITEEKKVWKMENSDVTLLEVKAPIVTVDNEGYEKLADAISKKWPGLGDNEYEQMRTDAKEQYMAMSPEMQAYFGGYAETEEVEATRCDNSVVSFKGFYYDYMGGVHGNYGYAGVNFDTATGKELELSDILVNPERFYEKAVPYIESELWAEYSEGLFPDYKDWVAGTFTERSVNWYMDASGIVIIYNTYEVGPYVMGSALITLPYSHFGEFIKGDYKIYEGELVAEISAENNFDDIVEAPKPIYFKIVEDENYMEHISIVSGNKNIEVATVSYLDSAYLIKKADGRSFLVMVCDYMSTDMVTLVYDVTYGDVAKCMELSDAEITGNYISANEIEMGIYLDVMGSYIGTMRYVFGENGELTAKDKVFAIQPGEPLMITKPLPAMVEGKGVIIDAGKQIVVIGTNNVDEVYFKMVDSEATGTIFYDRDSVDTWKIMIDGVWEEEYFEMLPYAG